MNVFGTLVLALASQLFAGAPGADRRETEKCVHVERMPNLKSWRESGDRMPVARVDTARVERMPVLRLQPCYMTDSLARFPARSTLTPGGR